MTNRKGNQPDLHVKIYAKFLVSKISKDANNLALLTTHRRLEEFVIAGQKKHIMKTVLCAMTNGIVYPSLCLTEPPTNAERVKYALRNDRRRGRKNSIDQLMWLRNMAMRPVEKRIF